MPSTFFGLNIAYSGVNHYQAALNTTGNNIANAATKGYTRQQTVQEAAMALRTNTTYGMAGSGVVTTAIEQVFGSEDSFDIMFDTDDIIDFSSYEKGKELLKKYDITF